MAARAKEAFHAQPDSKPLSADEAVLKEDSDLKLLEMLYIRHTNTGTMGLFLALADGIIATDKPTMADLHPEMDAMPKGKQRRAAKKDKGAAPGPPDPASGIKTFDVEMSQATSSTASGSSSGAASEQWVDPGAWDTKRAKTSAPGGRWQPKWKW